MTYRKIFITLGALLTLVLSSFFSLSLAKDEAKSRLSVTAAVPVSFPPYYQINKKGQPEGFAIDIMDALAIQSGIHVQYKVKENWGDVFKAAQSGSVDLIPNVGATEHRKSFLLFTKPVETFQISLFIRDESSRKYKSLNHLSGEKIAAVESNIGYKLISKNKSITAVPYKTFEEALYALFSGHVEALAYPEAVAWKTIKDAHLENKVQVIGEPLKEIKRVIGVTNNNKVLFEKLDKHIQNFILTEEYREIYIKWFSGRPTFWNANKLIWLFGIILMSFIASFLIWRHFSLLSAKSKLDILVNEKTEQLNQKIKSLEKVTDTLHKKEHILMSNLRNTPLAAITWDEYFICTEWNDSAEKIFGYTKDEAIGQSALDLIVPLEAKPLVGNIFDTLLSTDGGTHSVNENIGKDGNSILCEWFNSPITDKNGVVIAVTSMAQDITKQNEDKNELIKTKLTLQAILNTIPARVYWKDTQNIYMGCNHSFALDVGLNSPEDIVGKNDFDLNWKGFAATTIEDDNQVMTKKQAYVRINDPRVIPSGELKWFETSRIPLINESGSVQGMLGVFHDVTDRKETEEKLIQTTIEAEKANKAKSIFLTNISHELRTPMHGILSFAQFGIDLTENDASGKLFKYFTQILDSGSRLLSLLNNLLDISKLEAGKMQMECTPSSFSSVIDSCVNEQQARLDEHDMKIDLNDTSNNQIIDMDKDRIAQVITNLLSNAIKFNTNSQPIHICVQLEKLDADDAISFSIRDHGIGIPKNELTRVFDKFYQSTLTSSGTSGTGLGLPISHEIIDAHHGKIWVENHPDGGSCFKFMLPL